MPAQQFIQVPVRMGSNKFNLELILNNQDEERSIHCGKFIEIVLRKCNLHGSSNLRKTYSIFESSCGVERLLQRNEDIIQILRQNQMKQLKFEFVIRKCNSIELNLTQQEKQSKQVKKCYKKLKQMKQIDDKLTAASEKRQSNESIIHIYEPVDKFETSLQVKDDEEEVKETIKFNEMKIEQNINVLQYLYSKLKAHQLSCSKNKYFDAINTSRIALLSKDYNSCGNSSSDECSSNSSSSKCSRSSSSSALESLV
jgi:hypothetical protein